MQLDYNLQTPEERISYVDSFLKQNSKTYLNKKALSYLSDYILFVGDKNQTKKEKKTDKPILTKNREATIDKRQISYEGIVATLENGEDGLYNMIRNDKNQILDPRSPITDLDKETIPGLKEYMDTIDSLQSQLVHAKGAAKWSLKKAIIETWQQAYILKSSWSGAVGRLKPANQIKIISHMDIPEDVYFNEEGIPLSRAKISLLNTTHVSFLLCYYSALKEECYDNLQSDLHFILLDLENLVDKALLDKYPLLYDIVIWKVDGLTNEEIQEKVEAKYGEWHSEQYYSSVWRQRIPRLIVEEAQKQYVTWYYTNVEKGYWKRCTKCGEIKLGHSLFFSRNTSKDGWYSQCKDCKNGKGKGKK